MKKVIIAIAALAALSTTSFARTDIDPRDRKAGDFNATSSAYDITAIGNKDITYTSAFAVGGQAGETAFERMVRLQNTRKYSSSR